MRASSIPVTLPVVILLLSSCGPPPEEEGIQSIPVSVVTMEPSTISREAYASTRLEGEEEALIYASTMGRVEEVLVSEGDSVTTGQHLVRLDTDQQITAGTSSAIASVNAARANAENALVDYERMLSLLDAGAVSQQQLDGARVMAEAATAQLRQAEAGYSQARSMQDNAVISAPFSGRIGRIWAREGNTSSGNPLLSISGSSGIVARILLPERDIYRLSPGLPAYVSVTALDGRSIPGIVTSVSPSVDPVSGLVSVQVVFDDTEGVLRPGMTGRVSVLTETVELAIVLPESVLRRSRDGYQVAVVEDGTAYLRDVQTGIRNGGNVEITEGITAGDVVIVQGQTRVSDGSLVEVVE
jgi:membrane fusion protein (multidrug efflux system)